MGFEKHCLEENAFYRRLLSGEFTAETLPQILSAEERGIYQRAADALERRSFPPSEPFDRGKWAAWLRSSEGKLCTAIDERILQWDDGKR